MTDKMTDPILMAEELGRLREENKNLKSAVSAAEGRATRAQVVRYLRPVLLLSVFLPVATGLLSTIGYPIYKSYSTPVVVDHCYLVHEHYPQPSFKLIGNIEWHDDVIHGIFPSVNEAVAAAEKV